MVLPLIAIIGVSVIASAIPFFFQTPAEKATVELNQRIESGQFQILQTDQKNSQLTDNKKTMLIVVAVIAIIVVIVMFGRKK